MVVVFMKRKRGQPNFTMSEPKLLIDVMDRHTDWAVTDCLIGCGQEINTGEARLIEWFDALQNTSTLAGGCFEWITDTEYLMQKVPAYFLPANQLT